MIDATGSVRKIEDVERLPVRQALANALTPAVPPSVSKPATIPDDMFRTRWEPIEAALGARYAECSLESFAISSDKRFAALQTDVLAELRAYLDDLAGNVKAGRGVVLFGPPGTGKDHLLVGMLRESVRRGLRTRWVDGMRLYRKVREAIRTDTGEGSVAKPLIDAEVLAISDPIPPKGESVTGFQAAFMFSLIDARYRARRPTWVTANFADRDDADSRLGAQIVDRLRDGALACNCVWPSYRKPA